MATTVLKPISMTTNACITSVPSLLTPSKASYSHPCISFPFKPFKIQVSCSYSSLLSLPSLFSLKKKESISRASVITAQQEEGNPVLYEEAEAKSTWDASETESTGAVGSEGESDELIEEAKLYVGNLPYDVDSDKLAELFNEAGVVEISQVIYDRETDRSKGFAFVTMRTVEEAEKAVEMFHRYDLNGRFLTVNKAARKGERPPRVFEPTYRLYVGSLPWKVNDARLEEVFSEHGKVVSARVVIDRESGRSRGFGFVEMASELEMNDAIANLDGQSLEGRAIIVNVAQERPRRGSF